MTRRATFSQSDVTRALKAVTGAGVPIGEIEVDLRAGKVRIHPPGATSAGDRRPNAFDTDAG